MSGQTANNRFWFMFHKDKILLAEDASGGLHIPCAPAAPLEAAGLTHSLSEYNGLPCQAFAVTEFPADASPKCCAGNEKALRYLPMELRNDFYDMFGEELFAIAGHGKQMLHWDRTSQFCPLCGTKTKVDTPKSKKCPACGHEMFPHLYVAILALVTKGDSTLLVKAHNVKQDVHVLVAGFLEPGESLEQCVRREVLEETNIQVRNIRYFASQSWPHLSNMMIGFFAEYESGEIRLQEDELRAAAFYRRDNMPPVPKPMSLTSRLIDWWVSGRELPIGNDGKNSHLPDPRVD
ncbi:MAG: NAD(+) diphosphatase [Deltaproteobacteria bacterium]|nr:NAD(+) diphosphatase [Deltaproteobacteria bacterium]